MAGKKGIECVTRRKSDRRLCGSRNRTKYERFSFIAHVAGLIWNNALLLSGNLLSGARIADTTAYLLFRIFKVKKSGATELKSTILLIGSVLMGKGKNNVS